MPSCVTVFILTLCWSRMPLYNLKCGCQRDSAYLHIRPGLPLGLENMWKKEKAFFNQWKVGEFSTDWKSRGKSHRILEKLKIFRRCYLLFLVIFKWTEYYLLKWITFSVNKTKHLKILEKWEKYRKNQGSLSRGILSVLKSRNHEDCCLPPLALQVLNG